MSRRALHTASGGAIYRHRYIAPPEALYSAPTDMYRPGPIHNTGRYLAGFALHTGTATYRAQTRYIGGATFLMPSGRFFSRYPRRDMAGYRGIPRDAARYREMAQKNRPDQGFTCVICV